MKPELSIIIVNWNTKDLLLDCIRSIIRSKPKVKYEAIIVDNGSTDGSAETLKSLQARSGLFYSKTPTTKWVTQLQVIQNSENLGFAKANNQGIKVAKGKHILLLNSDTKVKNGAIDSLYSYAESHPETGVVGARLLNADGSIQPSCFRFPTIFNAIREYWFNEKGLFSKYFPSGEKPAQVDVVVGACFLITPMALKKVGLLNERFFFFFEDLDYCRRVRKANLMVYYLPDVEVYHYHGASIRKIVTKDDSWRNLIPGSKIYHGLLKYWILTFILWSGQKFGKIILPFLLILLTLPAVGNLLRPGYFPMQDDLQAFRIYEMDRCIDDLQIPCRWVPDAGYQYGYPQFNYYPPFPYYLGAILHRVGIQYIDSVKILFIAGYIFSALSMYVLVNALVGRWPAFISAALYIYIPYKAVEVYVRGAMSEFWAQIFFPLIFWSIYKLIKNGKLIYLIFLSLSAGMLATTHTLMTMIFIPIAGIWTLFWLIRYKWSNTFKIITGAILGYGLSAFFTLPLLFERKFAHVESLLSGYFDYRQHFVSLYKLFLSMEWGYGSSGFPNEKLNLSLGIVTWIVGLVIAPLLALLKFRKNKNISILVLVLTVTALVSVFMMHLRSSFIWVKLPFLWYMQFPWRFLAVSIYMLCLLVGFAIYFSGKFKHIFGFGLILASIILYLPFFTPKDWVNISDREKFSGALWEKQLTISIFDYLPIYATLPPGQKAPETPEVLEGKARFSEYKKGSNIQRGRVEVEENSTIRLPLFDFPGMEASVDDQKVSHRHDDCRNERYCLGLITFDISAGKHEISAKLQDTPIRKVGNTITIVSLAVLVLLAVKSKHENISF